ncbi:MAG TPA: hypothetical protein VJ785_02230 [Anaerolineales bacterium]|nr:hypothetical protein [Anaerolineales bacterium]
MSRLVNIVLALVLLAALIIVLDPNARLKAAEAVRDLQPTLQQLDERIVVNVPDIGMTDQPSTPAPTHTPFPTATADGEGQIPVTGDEDSSDEPIMQVNWDALGDALRNFWNRLKDVEIDLTPNVNQ